ncbi:hypothetical protein LTR53_017857, partial [Teratosphaeriaceae sp. CCFEE 6253]
MAHTFLLTAADGAGTTSEFPKFDSADVKIVISTLRQYELHSSVLRAVSSRMKHQLLLEKNAAGLCNKAIKRGVSIRFRLDLVDNLEYSELDSNTVKYILRIVALDNKGRPLNPHANPIAL